MSVPHTMTIELPAELYERVRQVAERSGVSEETAFLEGMSWFYTVVPYNKEAVFQKLPSFSNTQLWAIVYQRLNAQDDDRLTELLEKNQAGLLEEHEKLDRDALIKLIDYQVLLRSKALVLLKERGQDADGYFYADEP
jgi:hypothetical protein